MIELKDVVLGDLVKEKPYLCEINAHSTINDGLNLLKNNNIISLPIYGQAGHWLGAGNTEMIVGKKQYIGICSIMDIMCHILKRIESYSKQYNETPSQLLEDGVLTPILQEHISDVIGETLESQSLWIKANSEKLEHTMSLLSQGVHRILIKYQGSDEIRLLSQADILRSLLQVKGQSNSAVLNRKFASKVSELVSASFATRDPVTVTVDDRVLTAMTKFVQFKVSALPVLDAAQQVVSAISASDFKAIAIDANPEHNILNQMLKIPDLTVADFLKLSHGNAVPAAVTCSQDDSVEQLVQILLSKGIHQVWVQTAGNELCVISMTDLLAFFVKA